MPQDAKPFALVVRFTVRPGAEAQFDALVAETAAGIRDHEPGTLVYACHTVQDQPRQRIFYELYRDREASRPTSRPLIPGGSSSGATRSWKPPRWNSST